MRESRAGVESAERHEVEVRGNDDGVRRVEVLVGLVADIVCDDVDFNAWVQLLELRCCCFGALVDLVQ